MIISTQTQTITCRVCGEQWKVTTHCLPEKTVNMILNFKTIIHYLRKHPKEITARYWLGFVKSIFCGLGVFFVWVIVMIIRLALYPLYWVLEKLY